MPDKTDQFEVIVYNAVRGIALSPGDKNPQELYKTLNVRAPAVLSQLRALRTQSSPSSPGSPSASSSSEDSPEIQPKKLVATIFLPKANIKVSKSYFEKRMAAGMANAVEAAICRTHYEECKKWMIENITGDLELTETIRQAIAEAENECKEVFLFKV
jgi:hypothetical protein